MDISKMSDAELMAAANAGAPARPDLSKMSDAELLAASAQKPQRDKGVVLNAIDYVNGIADWPDRLMASGVGLIAKGTDAVGLTNGADAMFSAMRNDAPRNKYASTGAIVGDIGATLPLNGIRVAKALPQITNAGRVVKGGARIGDAALQGGTATLATSSANDAPLGDQLTLGAGLSAAVPTLGMVARGGKNLIRGVIGETTGAGGQSLANAYAAGRAGGDQAKAFTSSLRNGTANWDEVVTEAKGALSNLKAERGKAYRAGMVDISQDKSVLDFTPVDEAITGASTVKNFKGRDLSKSTAEVRKEIADTVAEWKALDPAEYHTPEGFDAMKQELKDILDKQDPSKPAYVVAKTAYDAVRNTIAKQAPAYDKVMRKYAEASDEIAKIEKELSLNPKANPNTALRKLQSVLRDNANTSWGNRAGMADRLAEAGAPNLLSSLSGQALSTSIPRGLAKFADGAAIGGAALAGNPMSLAALPFASPRLMGEAAYGLGAFNRGATGLLGRMPQVPLPSAAMFSPAIGATAPGLLGSR